MTRMHGWILARRGIPIVNRRHIQEAFIDDLKERIGVECADNFEARRGLAVEDQCRGLLVEIDIANFEG